MDDSVFVKNRRKKEMIIDGVVLDQPEIVMQSVCKPGIIKKDHPIQLSQYNKFLRLEGSYWEVLPKEKVDIIYSNTFSLLPNLTTIVISQVDLEAIEPGAFKGLQNLLYLNLYRNKLSKLPDDLFDDTPNLIHLNLDNNKIEAIGASLFSNLTKLQVLHFALNNLEDLPKDWDSGLSSLRTLTLTTNNLQVIKSEMFLNCKEVEDLDLGVNDIDVIEKDAFKGLQKLEKLCIIYNGKINVDLAHELSNLPSLKEISLCSNSFDPSVYEAAKKILDARQIDVTDMMPISSYTIEDVDAENLNAEDEENCC